MQTLESFFLVKTAVKFRNLQISKVLNTDTNRFSQFFSRLCTYLWDIHSLKNKPALSIFGYSYGVNQNVSLTSTLIFSKLKVLLWTIKRRNNNPLLSKSTLKYLAYCQVFRVEVRRLQDQCISIWALLFYYCIFNNLPREKTLIQM